MRLLATGRAIRLHHSRWSINRANGQGVCALFTIPAANHPGFRYSSSSQGPEQKSSQSTAATLNSATTSSALGAESQGTIIVEGKSYPTDQWTNATPSILSHISKGLYTRENHPLYITRKLIESQFPGPTYGNYTEKNPVVTTAQNFDVLGFPLDHPGRSRTDTYYVNEKTVLRTHTSAHQAEYFRRMAEENAKEDGYTVAADVYRRDAIDRSHYPVFHQMEGARLWKRTPGMTASESAARILEDVKKLPTHDVEVEDPNPVTHPERNPLQADYHSQEEVDAVVAHLKRNLELLVVRIFSEASKASQDSGSPPEPLKIRWIEGYFPFTSPSYELEVFWQGDWLEVVGCGVIKQELLNNSGVPDRIGWAFGLGLERIAMLLFEIPDIRLFWSQDSRFLSQFRNDKIVRFQPFSKHPECYKDVAFWLSSAATSGTGASAAGGAISFHDNDMMEIVRECAKDIVEDVKLVDEFVHPKTGRKSLCYRINYRSLEHTLTNKEVNVVHEQVRQTLVESRPGERTMGTSVKTTELMPATTEQQQQPKKVVKKIHYPFWFGGSASCFAAAVTHPLDLARAPNAPTSMLGTFVHVAKNNGVLGLYSGLSAAILRQMTYSTTRFGVYEELKSHFTDPNSSPKMLSLLWMGCLSGFLGGIAGNFADLINVRMQNDAALPPHKRRNYKHAIDGVVRMTREEGFASLFRGVWPNSTRAVLMTASQLVSYDIFKRICTDKLGMPDSLSTHFTASISAGFVATTVCSPVDVIKTRVMSAHHTDTKAGLMHLLRDIYRKEGVSWMFRGWVPAFVRLGPHTIATFLFLEEHKKLYRKIKDL
ncbi:phenylalanyl-tRNA synthetase alpha subunit (PodG), putative [Talaromyces stipitatus ATCC 10500]|uniref:Phenylalanine--tRNA ligase, mitochondrial n=1 Tax=Talaromyces stipitatus (strain ATCC 10500 / CBS 375.48 / QM 6759 / NRRL 1006) TaxID=441959 RepID=B8M3P4_TALSN|nr:phenylalanyl-tRNA synthetase alpha subunit (PodG), putative [Talaromyces stipitatus ATCC 10500]EED22416.1 phenylalanyl-tRNA synthetase alpha subunit (PodG), putative [Talaromyces stipitatus ATCC 10500]